MPEKNQDQTIRSQRLETLGTLAGGIAHDLNNILAPIMMSIEVLALGETDLHRLKTLDTIAICCRRGSDMVKQVLLFLRGVEVKLTKLQTDKILYDIEKIVGETFLKSMEIKCFVPSNLWHVLGDATQLHQVLLNLCVNARDAMPSGGKLTLTAENLRMDELSPLISGERVHGPYIRISVEDTGTGMSKAILERIFEPFFTTKEFGKGTGLGLSTSLTIIKNHGGFIGAHSEVGIGTRFSLYLPALEAESSQEP